MGSDAHLSKNFLSAVENLPRCTHFHQKISLVRESFYYQVRVYRKMPCPRILIAILDLFVRIHTVQKQKSAGGGGAAAFEIRTVSPYFDYLVVPLAYPIAKSQNRLSWAGKKYVWIAKVHSTHLMALLMR